MNDLCVIVPTRNRPENAERLAKRWQEVTTSAALVFALDDDDPKLGDYITLMNSIDAQQRIYSTTKPRTERRMAGALNGFASEAAEHFYAVGFMGDDHLPQTGKWDEYVLAALREREPGIVYCNDLFQRVNLPTQVFIDSRIIKTLGYMVPDGLTHMFLDNTWLTWGRALGTIGYLDDIIIEHIHPAAGKTDGDVGYAEADGFMGPDGMAFERYLSDGRFHADMEKLEALKAGL